MNHEVPDFQSDIPPHLLTNATPQDKYIMENISILGQKCNWLTETQKEQSKRLEGLTMTSEEIKVQTTKTNGKVLVLQEQTKSAESVVHAYHHLKRLSRRKSFILFAIFSFIVFFSYITPWVEVHGKEFIPSVVRMFFGE